MLDMWIRNICVDRMHSHGRCFLHGLDIMFVWRDISDSSTYKHLGHYLLAVHQFVLRWQRVDWSLQWNHEFRLHCVHNRHVSAELSRHNMLSMLEILSNGICPIGKLHVYFVSVVCAMYKHVQFWFLPCRRVQFYKQSHMSDMQQLS